MKQSGIENTGTLSAAGTAKNNNAAIGYKILQDGCKAGVYGRSSGFRFRHQENIFSHKSCLQGSSACGIDGCKSIIGKILVDGCQCIRVFSGKISSVSECKNFQCSGDSAGTAFNRKSQISSRKISD